MKKYDFTELNGIPFSSVAEKLDSVKRKGAQITTTCPWHEDKHPSLVIYDNEKGNRCKCFACGRSGSVIDYVMAKRNVEMLDACDWLSSTFGRGVMEEDAAGSEHGDKKPCKKKKPHKSTKQILDEATEERKRREEQVRQAADGDEYAWFDPEHYEKHCISSDNSFCKCLRHIFDEDIVERATTIYGLGRYDGMDNPDDVMFPSIDLEGCIRNIKVQNYDSNPQSENFFHCDKKRIFWLGEIMRKNGEFPTNAKFNNSVLFGENLLSIFPNMDVVLVESPKNAIVGWCAYNDFIWIAAGNKNNLNRKCLEPLRNRRVIVIPDCDAIDEWKQRLDQLRDITPFRISSICTTALPSLGPKADIADLIISQKMG